MNIKEKLLYTFCAIIVIASICLIVSVFNQSDKDMNTSIESETFVESTDVEVHTIAEDEEKMLKATISSYCPFNFPINYTTVMLHNEDGKRLYQTTRKDIDVFYASYKKDDVVEEHGSWGAIRVSAYNVACYSAIYPVINFSPNASVNVFDTTTEPPVTTTEPVTSSTDELLSDDVLNNITVTEIDTTIGMTNSPTTTEPPTTLPIERYKYYQVKGKVLFDSHFTNDLQKEVPPPSDEVIKEYKRLVKNGYNFYAVVIENGKYLDYIVVVDKSEKQDQDKYIKDYCESLSKTYYNKIITNN